MDDNWGYPYFRKRPISASADIFLGKSLQFCKVLALACVVHVSYCFVTMCIYFCNRIMYMYIYILLYIIIYLNTQCINKSINIYVYIYIHIHTVYVYIYIYILYPKLSKSLHQVDLQSPQGICLSVASLRMGMLLQGRRGGVSKGCFF